MAEFEFLVKSEQPHIIGVSEILPKNFNRKIYKEEFNVDNYDMIAHSNIENNKGRGSALYIHKSLNCKQVHIKPSEEFEENVLAEINLDKGDKLLCGLFYRRGEGSDENDDNLIKLFTKITEANYSHTLLFGDLNLPGIDWDSWSTSIIDSESYENRFIECARDCFLFQHVTEPTRVRGNDQPSTLDLIFTNEENMIDKLCLEAPLGKSDHSIIKFNFIAEKAHEAPKIQTLFHKGDYKALSEELNINWEEELNKHPGRVEDQWNIFKDKFDEAVKNHIPKKIMLINGKPAKKFTIPLSQENLRKIKQKNKLWSKKRKNLADEEQKLNYNRIRNQIRTLTRKGKKLYEKEIAKKSKSNPKAFWKYTRSKLKTKTGIPDLLINPDSSKKTYTKNDDEKASVLQNFFSSVFTHEPPGDLPEFREREFQEKLQSIEITSDMVNEKLRKIKINKSPGPDQIHPRVLHEIKGSISVPIAIIFNTSLKTATLPHDWKEANVSAIYKKGNKSHPGNYRPVSLTSILCKLLEGFIRDAVVKHMRENGLFSDKQFGFIAGRSTMLQLLKVMDIWTEILDQGGSIDAIYCDFMKAFDKVPHARLIYKVKQYGIDGDILGWIKHFLADRTQKVIINNSKSKPAKVTSGIPQGSVLGPLLFVLYINDLPEVVDKDTFIYLFADDTKAFRQIRSTEDKLQLQKDIEEMVKWSNIWLLEFHPLKCVMMHLGKVDETTTVPEHGAVNENQINSTNEFQYTMEGHPLDYSKCEKDLGVFIDNKLDFQKHIDYSINKANRVMAVARRTFDYMDKEIFLNIYKGMVRPHVEYASSVWAPHLVKHINALEKVQIRATRQVPGLSTNYEKRLKTLKLPTLAYRRLRGDMIQAYKILHPEVGYDKSLPKFFDDANTSHLRGHSQKLPVTRFNKDIKKYNFSQRIQKYWNSLPEDVINAGDVWKFEDKLDKFWQNQPLLYDYRAEIKFRQDRYEPD